MVKSVKSLVKTKNQLIGLVNYDIGFLDWYRRDPSLWISIGFDPYFWINKFRSFILLKLRYRLLHFGSVLASTFILDRYLHCGSVSASTLHSGIWICISFDLHSGSISASTLRSGSVSASTFRFGSPTRAFGYAATRWTFNILVILK
ncbi:hypothetical protein RhiirC2_717805 [Rhizophagus irregularis]|uniref:Uncharacterized protein n=1 Tax=Rhizophagus irregularis TaxID=588596 RepID=A0A2N1MKY6_9GLOM|nr:hypothetical protein RhiirC2_717805 [Rhizophagus irregularis]